MGIFHAQIELVNRTSKELNVRFDGQDLPLAPNYTPAGEFIADVHNMVPEIVAPYAKHQNVLNGSEDPLDPNHWETLVGVVAKRGEKQRDDISFLEQSDEPTRVRLGDYLDDPTLKIQVGGRRRPTEVRPANDTTPFDVRAR